MKRNLLIWIMAAVSLSSIAALITIWISFHRFDREHFNNRHNNIERQHHERGGGLLTALNLDEKQMNEFTEIRNGHHKRVMPVLDGIRRLRQEFFSILRLEQTDTTKLNIQIDEIADAEVLLQHESARFIIELKAILNSVQQDSLFNFMSRHMDPKIPGMCGPEQSKCKTTSHCGKHQ